MYPKGGRRLCRCSERGSVAAVRGQLVIAATRHTSFLFTLYNSRARSPSLSLRQVHASNTHTPRHPQQSVPSHLSKRLCTYTSLHHDQTHHRSHTHMWAYLHACVYIRHTYTASLTTRCTSPPHYTPHIKTKIPLRITSHLPSTPARLPTQPISYKKHVLCPS